MTLSEFYKQEPIAITNSLKLLSLNEFEHFPELGVLNVFNGQDHKVKAGILGVSIHVHSFWKTHRNTPYCSYTVKFEGENFMAVVEGPYRTSKRFVNSGYLYDRALKAAIDMRDLPTITSLADVVESLSWDETSKESFAEFTEEW